MDKHEDRDSGPGGGPNLPTQPPHSRSLLANFQVPLIKGQVYCTIFGFGVGHEACFGHQNKAALATRIRQNDMSASRHDIKSLQVPIAFLSFCHCHDKCTWASPWVSRIGRETGSSATPAELLCQAQLNMLLSAIGFEYLLLSNSLLIQ